MNKMIAFILSATAILSVVATPVAAGEFPERKIQVSFPWKAGGPAYVLSQIISDGMANDLGVDISVVDGKVILPYKVFLHSFPTILCIFG